MNPFELAGATDKVGAGSVLKGNLLVHRSGS